MCIKTESFKAAYSRIKEQVTDLIRKAVRSVNRINAFGVNPLSTELEPIFVVGCGHSGTTLLTAILGMHPNLYAVDHETMLFNKLHSRKEIKSKILEFYKLAEKQSAKHIVEKTPRHIYEIDRILKYYPKARFLAIIRDGRDVACSIKKRKNSFKQGVLRWINDNNEIISRKDNNKIFILKYEDLVSDLKSTMEKVSDFLKEEYTQDYENHHSKKYNYQQVENIVKPETVVGKDHNVFRAWQVNQPIFDGRFRWKEEMSESEKDYFKKEANDLLVHFGYEKDINW